MRRGALAVLVVACAAVAAGPARAQSADDDTGAPLPPKLAALEVKKNTPPPSKAERDKLDARLKKLVGKKPETVVNLHNLWTTEWMALDVKKGSSVDDTTFNRFLRCHFTNEPTRMDPRLQSVLLGAALRFRTERIEIVSGFRAPKFNLMLRKKGHEVARDSQHTYGHAVDFRIPGVATRRLLGFVKSLHLGGAGFYPESEFVHADTGPVRTWLGR